MLLAFNLAVLYSYIFEMERIRLYETGQKGTYDRRNQSIKWIAIALTVIQALCVGTDNLKTMIGMGQTESAIILSIAIILKIIVDLYIYFILIRGLVFINK